MPGFGRRIDQPHERRRRQRWQICVVGTAISLGQSKSVLIEDLCGTGARLLGRHLPGPGKEVIVRTEGLDFFGHIAWARDDQRGMTFDLPGA